MRKFWWIGGLILVIALGGGFFLGRNTAPAQVLAQYPLAMLSEEAATMVECAECHEHAPAEFHTCDTCHDDHGAVEFADVPFYAVIAFQGDVPEPGYIQINEILPYQDQPNTFVMVKEFLAEKGVTDFESVTFASRDEGFVTVTRENLTEAARLMPYVDGVRFASEDLHVSTWIKGITRIIVVGTETPLTIDGEATSMGRLLLGPTRAVTVEQTDVMLKGQDDGEVRRGKTASRVTGVPLTTLLGADFDAVTVETAGGETATLDAAEVEGAVLAQRRDSPTLILPGRGRSEWIGDVVALSAGR
jgi:hypothetical protein